MFVSYILLTASALFMVFQDVRQQTVPLYGLVVFAVISLLNQVWETNPDRLWAAITIVLIFLTLHAVFYLIKRQSAFGWGDIILSPFCGLWLYFSEIPHYLVTVGVLALLTGLLWRNRWGLRTFPMAPSLLLGLGIVLLIRCFLTRNGI